MIKKMKMKTMSHHLHPPSLPLLPPRHREPGHRQQPRRPPRRHGKGHPPPEFKVAPLPPRVAPTVLDEPVLAVGRGLAVADDDDGVVQGFGAADLMGEK